LFTFFSGKPQEATRKPPGSHQEATRKPSWGLPSVPSLIVLTEYENKNVSSEKNSIPFGIVKAPKKDNFYASFLTSVRMSSGRPLEAPKKPSESPRKPPGSPGFF